MKTHWLYLFIFLLLLSCCNNEDSGYRINVKGDIIEDQGHQTIFFPANGGTKQILVSAFYNGNTIDNNEYDLGWLNLFDAKWLIRTPDDYLSCTKDPIILTVTASPNNSVDTREFVDYIDLRKDLKEVRSYPIRFFQEGKKTNDSDNC